MKKKKMMNKKKSKKKKRKMKNKQKKQLKKRMNGNHTYQMYQVKYAGLIIVHKIHFGYQWMTMMLAICMNVSF